LAALGCVLTLAACADFSRGPVSEAAPDAGAPADGGDAVAADGTAGTSFATDIEPLLVPTCQACHAPGAEAGDTRLLLTGNAAIDYPTVMAFVDPSSPSSSRLLSKMSGNGHQGGAVYPAGSPEYLTVRRWIDQGAPP
jgi:hypothetical protein